MATKKKPVDGATEADFEDIELEAEVSDRVLEDTPERVIRFILAARQHPHIYRLLYARGYNRATVREAWALLDKLGGVTSAAVDGEDDEPSDDEKAVARAISELDAWDEPNFAVIDAALRRRFPEQHKFLFAGGLKANAGLLAVAGVRTMAQRLDALESSPERKATRKEDKAALDLLAKRGIDKAEREKIARWLATVGDHDDTLLEGEDESADLDRKFEVVRKNSLVRLREWFEEWARVARTAVKRKRDLMHLGLARQKKKGQDPNDDEDPTKKLR
ncbi:MAG: hypothetical protein U0183_22130 [Polyangiaceae bacterium]